MQRMLAADQARFAAEIARRSRPELGLESPARARGYDGAQIRVDGANSIAPAHR